VTGGESGERHDRIFYFNVEKKLIRVIGSSLPILLNEGRRREEEGMRGTLWPASSHG
jgi:hypothetical protein